MLKKDFDKFKKLCDESLEKYNSKRIATNPYGCIISDIDDVGASFGLVVDDVSGSPNIYYEEKSNRILNVVDVEGNTVANLTLNLYRSGLNSEQKGGSYETNSYLLKAPPKPRNKLKY